MGSNPPISYLVRTWERKNSRKEEITWTLYKVISTYEGITEVNWDCWDQDGNLVWDSDVPGLSQKAAETSVNFLLNSPGYTFV